MPPTNQASSTVYESARRCILSIFSCFPQPIKTFGLSILPTLEPKISSNDYGSPVYDIIFAGGYFQNVLYQSCNCTDSLNYVRRCYCLRYCRPSCWGWSFLENSGEFWKEIWSLSRFDLKHRSWKLVHIPAMNQLSYSQDVIFASALIPQKYLHIMRQNLVLLCVVVRRSSLQDGYLAEDLVLTVRTLFYWLMLTLIWGIKLLFMQGQPPRIMTIGKMYMGIKDGVLSIWYHFSKKWELYSLPSQTLANNYGYFHRQKHINQFQRTLLMANQDLSKCR